jgi:PKD repeat protein
MNYRYYYDLSGRRTMQEIDKVEFNVFERQNRGRGIGIGFFAVFLFLFLLATGANAYVCSDCHTPLHGECPNCTTANCHTNKLENINHLSGTGTPLEGDLSSAEGITVVCKTCHEGPNTLHPFIINTDPTIIITGITDLDYACGQCHGGGNNEINNPPQPGVPYYTKARLAPVAEGMHASAGVSFPVTFTTSVPANTLDVNVAASVDCGGTCPTLTYDWDWDNDGPAGNGPATTASASHTYTSAGPKTIKLTVSITAGTVGSTTRNVTVNAVDLAPTAAATCAWDADTWNMVVTNSSTDDGADDDATVGDGTASLTYKINWGSPNSLVTAPPLSRSYCTVGTFSVSLKATDTKFQTSTAVCATQATPAYKTISGTVKKHDGTTNLTYATVKLTQTSSTGGCALMAPQSKSTGTTGNFSFTNLKPGTYSVTVTKLGYTFPAVTPITVGPSGTTGNIIAN